MKKYAVVFESGMVNEQIVRSDFTSSAKAWAFANKKYGKNGVEQYNVQVAIICNNGELSYDY